MRGYGAWSKRGRGRIKVAASNKYTFWYNEECI